jgi:hypothetical protein
MVLRDVAEDIGMHESTISRVTTNKYAHTPQGIFELKYFFNSSIKRVHGEDIASASVQAKIKKTDRRGKPKKTIQRQQNGRNAQNGQYRHCPSHGCQIPGNDGHLILQQAKAILMAFLGSRPMFLTVPPHLNRQAAYVAPADRPVDRYSKKEAALHEYIRQIQEPRTLRCPQILCCEKN